MATLGALRHLATGYCTPIAPTSSVHQTSVQTFAFGQRSRVQIGAKQFRPIRIARSRLLLEEDFDAIGSPNCDPGSEEIRVLGPDVTRERQSGGKHWPVFLVPTPKTLPGFGFKQAVPILADTALNFFAE